jgi:hypothetical protein
MLEIASLTLSFGDELPPANKFLFRYLRVGGKSRIAIILEFIFSIDLSLPYVILSNLLFYLKGLTVEC